jgi:hypothetical protein
MLTGMSLIGKLFGMATTVLLDAGTTLIRPAKDNSLLALSDRILLGHAS